MPRGNRPPSGDDGDDDVLSLSKRLAVVEGTTVAQRRANIRALRDEFDNEILEPLEGVDFSKRPLDIQLIRRLAALQLTDGELMDVLQVDEATLESVYRPYIENGRAQGRTALRRMQWRVAMRGNVSMLIHLGSQYLDQPSKSELNVKGKIELEDVTDPRAKLLDLMREAAERLRASPVMLALPQPTINNDGEF